MLLLALLACGTPAPQTTTVTATADEHRATLAPEVTMDDFVALEDRMERRVVALEDRVSALELQVSELQVGFEGEATEISFDPSRTTLDARNVQEAVNELSTEVRGIKRMLGQDMGEPGQELFTIPEDNDQRGGPRGPGGGGPGGQGGPGQGGPGQTGGGQGGGSAPGWGG
jgi:hypothetical protein